MDKDSQLDKIEWLANNLQDDIGSEQWLNDAADFKRRLGINMFAPDGVYYEMRQENKRLLEALRSCRIVAGNGEYACDLNARGKL